MKVTVILVVIVTRSNLAAGQILLQVSYLRFQVLTFINNGREPRKDDTLPP